MRITSTLRRGYDALDAAFGVTETLFKSGEVYSEILLITAEGERDKAVLRREAIASYGDAIKRMEIIRIRGELLEDLIDLKLSAEEMQEVKALLPISKGN